MPTVLATPTDMLARVRDVRAAVVAGEAELLDLAAAWADAHPDLDEGDYESGDPDSPDHDPFIPTVDWSAGASFAAALGMSTAAGEAMIRDALVLRHRMPRVWRRVMDGEVDVWRARRVAKVVLGRPADVAELLDGTVAEVAHKVGPVVLDRLLDEAMLRLYPEEREQAQLEALDRSHVTLHEDTLIESGIGEMTIRGDWKDLKDFDDAVAEIAAALGVLAEEESQGADPLDVRRSKAVGVLADPARALALLEGSAPPKPRRRTHLFVHLSADAIEGMDPVGRCETSGRAVLEQQVRDWCGRSDSYLTVTGVIDLADRTSSEAYETADRFKTRNSLLVGHCVFPWCTRPARNCDKDHVVPYAQGGVTCDCNIAPLCRRHHRLKTHRGWRYTVVESGVWLWSDPHGQQFLRDGHGTLDVTPPDRPVTGGKSGGCRRAPPVHQSS